MEKNNVIYFRSTLEQMPTQQLDELLREELACEQVNEEKVRQILMILKKREEDYPLSVGGKAQTAWEKYLDNAEIAATEHTRKRKRTLRIAAVIIVAVTLAAVLPQSAVAKTLFERLVSWTDCVFALISPDDTRDLNCQYVFRTDDPGLQQVYDAVVELGVTQPVVPTWLPEGYELTGISITNTPVKNSVGSTFFDGAREANIVYYIYADVETSKYYKDETALATYEINGIVHYLSRNHDLWVIVWMNQNIECSIHIDCREDELYKIIGSIYTMEGETQ